MEGARIKKGRGRAERSEIEEKEFTIYDQVYYNQL
jgi:hypothetical protein